jgi:hypothetical protein
MSQGSKVTSHNPNHSVAIGGPRLSLGKAGVMGGRRPG